MDRPLDYYTFVETPIFTKRISELASLEMLEVIQSELVENPERWPVLKGVHGARKGRVAEPGSRRGKSGSFRYIYLYLPHAGRIHLLFLFAKGEQGTLTSNQTRAFSKVVAKIKDEAAYDQKKV